ncbi:hypothetical protein D3Z51_03225 [Clostridiaceae bacterium]|nr:hypothetical protein [Clostridiaceae bacterium]RKI16800.1 hypothetical protein D7V81_03505 [bacterium 1XD21-70]
MWDRKACCLDGLSGRQAFAFVLSCSHPLHFQANAWNGLPGRHGCLSFSRVQKKKTKRKQMFGKTCNLVNVVVK